MASLKKNVANQNITFCLINATTGAGLPGATVSSFVTKDAGAQASGGGTVTNQGNGQYNYAATQAETNATDVGFFFTATGAIPVNVDFHTDAVDANGLLQVDVEDINGSATAAQNVSKANQAIGRGTCTTGGSSTSVPTSAFSPGGSGNASGQFIGRTIIFDASTATQSLQGQASNITASTSGATPTFTIGALTTAPSSGDTFGVY